GPGFGIGIGLARDVRQMHVEGQDLYRCVRRNSDILKSEVILELDPVVFPAVARGCGQADDKWLAGGKILRFIVTLLVTVASQRNLQLRSLALLAITLEEERAGLLRVGEYRAWLHDEATTHDDAKKQSRYRHAKNRCEVTFHKANPQ